MNRPRSFVYSNGHTIDSRLCNQVANEEQALRVPVFLSLGLVHLQVITKGNLSAWRVWLAGQTTQSPRSHLTSTNPRDRPQASRVSIASQ